MKTTSIAFGSSTTCGFALAATGGGSGRKSGGIDGEPIKVDILVSGMQAAGKLVSSGGNLIEKLKEVSLEKGMDLTEKATDQAKPKTGDNAKSPTDGTVTGKTGGTLISATGMDNKISTEATKYKEGAVIHTEYGNGTQNKNGTQSYTPNAKATDTVPRLKRN